MLDLNIKDLILLVISLGAIIYATGRMSAQFATKEEVSANKDKHKEELSALEKETRAILEKKFLESQQEHRTYATKSALTKIETAMFDDIKEMREEAREGFKKMDENHKDLLGHIFGLMKQLTGKGSKNES